MATAVLIRTVTFTEKLYRGNGDVRVWLDRITARFGREARRYAPERTGVLRAGISTTTRRAGVHSVEGTIASRAPYTMFVLRGTTSPIRTTLGYGGIGEGFSYDTVRFPNGGFRRIRRPGYWMVLDDGMLPKFFADEVSGQHANNFLFSAWRATARDHRAIRAPKPIPGFVVNP